MKAKKTEAELTGATTSKIFRTAKKEFMNRCFLIPLACLCFLLGSTDSVPAQDKQDTKNNADQTLKSTGRVNPSTFAMEMDIPLTAYPGRGGGVPVSVSYSSKVWRMDFNTYEPVDPGCTSLWNPEFGEDSASGWTSSMGIAYIEYTGRDEFYDSLYGKPVSVQCFTSDAPIDEYAYIKRIQVHLPGGESHELRASDTPIAFTVNADPSTLDMTGTYYAVDGSKLRYVENSTTKRLYMPDGSFYDFASSTTPLDSKMIRKGTLYKDVNGNQLTYHDPTTTYPNGYWVDTMNRTIPVPLPLNEPAAAGVADYIIPGFNGASRTYKFHWKQLKGSNAAESGLTDFNEALRHKGDFYDLNSAYRNESDALFHSEYRNRATSLTSEGVFNPIVLTAIELPNGQKYEFSYNIYGEIERIKYPTGGEETFQYQKVAAVGAFDTNKPNKEATRGIHQRNVYESSGAAPYTWTYSSGASAEGYNLKRVVTAPDGTRTERDMYMGELPGTTVYGSWGFNNVLVGMAYEERAYASGGQILSKTKTVWAKTETAMSGTSVNPQRHPRVTKVESIIYDLTTGNALSSTSTMDYAGTLTDIDNHLDVNLTKRYGYTTSIGGLGTLEKQTEVVFLKYDSSYTWSDYESRNIVSLPTQVFIKDGAGTIKAKSEIKYDETSYGNGYRGQPTTTRSWLDTNNSWIETRSKYDAYGNVIETTDAKGNIGTISYDSTHHVFPIQTTSAIPDPSGANGSNTAFITTATFDPTTGLPLTATDANNQTTTISYAEPVTSVIDPLLRPRKVTASNGHQTITEYSAGISAATRFIKSRMQIDETKWKEGYSWFDGLGRPVKSQSVDSGGDVFALTCFDQYGRPSKTSNPFRNVSNPTCSSNLEWTTNTYDAAGRAWKVATPDNAFIETNYSLATSGNNIGTVVTVKDQALKERRSITNALGQLTRVDEPDVSDSNLLGAVDAPKQPTNYAYDTLGNLVTVSQIGTTSGQCGGGTPNCTQTRSFVYDSLSRLKSANNPESGVINYTYDNNGNLLTKTDARSITTTYAYDALNRVVTRDYSDSTRDVIYTYDNAAIANSKGKLTKVTNGNLSGGTIANPFSVTEYQQFDQMGRVTQSQQWVEGTAYGDPMTYTYNLSGALIEQKYPSGRVVKNVLDNDGDLSIVQSKKNANSGYWNYADSFIYTAAGAVTSMQLGNGRWESTSFNSRLQPTQIALGTVQSGTDKLKLNFDYGTTNNNGNVLSQQITVPTEVRNSTTYNGFTAAQTYTYDSLNRIKDAKEMIATNQQWKQTFTYDRYGNRNFDEANTTTLPKNCGGAVCTTDIPVVNPTINTTTNKNQLNGYTYDNVGNTTKDAQSRKFTYDAENKQTKVETVDSNGNVIATLGEYFYDGDGRRVKKYVPSTGETTVFIYDASGKLIAENSTLPSQIQTVSYLTSDHLGSPRINTDQNGAVIARHDYQPFGEEITRASYGNDDVRKQFTAYERDNETDLDYAQARYYKPSHGRFTSVDPLMASADIINPQTFNRYVYVGNNPVNVTDPTGEIWASNGSILKWFDSAADFTEGFTEYTSLIGVVNGRNVVLSATAGTWEDVANNAEALRKVAQMVGTGAAAFGASALSLGVPIAIATAYIAAIQYSPGQVDATMDDVPAAGRMIQNHVNMVNKKADELEAQVNQSGQSSTSQSATGNPNNQKDPNDNKPNTSANKSTPQEIAKKRGGELVNQNADAGQGVGRSGGGGTRYIKAGNQLIQEANKLPKNDPLRAAMKTEGNRLINRGRSINHK